MTTPRSGRERAPATPLSRFVLALLFGAASRFSPAARRSVAALLAAIDRAASPGRREGLRANLERLAAWGHPLLQTPAARAEVERAVFRSYHLGVLDYGAHRRVLRGAPGEPGTRFVGAERLYRALAVGRGAVITTAHLGNWELAGLALTRLGFTIHVVTGVQYHAAVTRAVREAKERARIRVSTPEEGFLPLVATLRRGGLVVLLADGDVRRRTLGVRFFGADAAIPAGPALLARRAGAPVVHAYAVRDDDGGRRIVFDSSDAPDRARPVAADVERMTRGIAAAMERAIAAHVTQWCIFRALEEPAAAPGVGAARAA